MHEDLQLESTWDKGWITFVAGGILGPSPIHSASICWAFLVFEKSLHDLLVAYYHRPLFIILLDTPKFTWLDLQLSLRPIQLLERGPTSPMNEFF